MDIVLDPGVSRDSIAREIVRRLPPGLTLEPPTRAAATAERMVRAFRFNLNALGSLTLLVGMFLVANAVSIAVLRRRPEIATLRALGTSRTAIFAAFLCEGLVVGLAGTALGEALGFAASRAALRAVAGTVSTIYAPTARIEGIDAAGPAALAALVGMAASLLATLAPAAEAMRVAPSPGMRAGSIEGVARRRLRTRALLAGLALLLAALASRAGPIDGFPLFGFAAVVLVVVALAFAAPLLVRAGAALPSRLLGGSLGPAGRLGAGFFGGALAKNGIAVTALAMALGMTLAMIVTVASIRQTVRVWVESTLRSDLWIKANAGGRSGNRGRPACPTSSVFSTASTAWTRWTRSARATRRIRRGRPFTLASGDFRVLARAGGLPFVDGRDPRATAAKARASGEVLVSEPFARRFGAAEGSALTLPTPSGPRPFRVAGVYYDYSNDRGTVVMDRELYLSIYGDPRVTSVAVLARPGVEPAELRRRVLAAAAGRYALTITTNRELRREVLVIFDRTFAVTRALEAIAVSVAVLGIANALMASAVERRRAFGLLRAVGASGEQIRRATFVEALLCGITGTIAAAAAGAAFAWILLTVINPQSFGWTVALAVPVRTLLGAAALVLARVGSRGARSRSRRRVRGPGRGSGGRMRRLLGILGALGTAALALGLAAASPIQFPRDHGAHPDVPLEWWYWTGHLQGSAGRQYGFQLTFFRLRDIHLAHFAWSDVASGRFTFEEKTHLALPGIAGSSPERLDVFNEDWSASREKSEHQQAPVRAARARPRGSTLTLSPAKPPVLHGEAGLSRKGPGPDEYSRYVSITRLNASGTLERNGKTESLTGHAWFDHEWGPGGLPAGIAGWDWFALHPRRRIRADALPDAPGGRDGVAILRRHVRSARPGRRAPWHGRTSGSRRRRHGRRLARRRTTPPSGISRWPRWVSRSRSRRFSRTRSS